MFNIATYHSVAKLSILSHKCIRIYHMKIFDKNNKINFVDTNNVFVGYDLEQKCCECTFYKLSSHDNLDDYVFDTEYFNLHEVDDNSNEYGCSFRLICPGKKDIYLSLYNVHNGYYAHGFKMQQKGNILFSGAL